MTIKSFSPIQSINSLLQPLGLSVSNKQQVLAKATMVALAALTFNQVMMQTANACNHCPNPHPSCGCLPGPDYPDLDYR